MSFDLFDDSETQPASPNDGRAIGSPAGEKLPAEAQGPGENRGKFEGLKAVGRFELKHRLGFGGFGVVYLAYDGLLKRQVALKLPRHVALAESSVRARFLREAEAAAGLDHPNIVPLYETGEVDEICYLASAYCPGPTLAQWMKQSHDPVPPDTAARIVAALADAVQHAHHAGILHRDIKPGNVMLDGQVPVGELPFTPKLMDFGLAISLKTEEGQPASTQIFGTPRYMAPEQAAGRDEDLSPAADIYSLGVILYEMLAGRPPIEGSSHASLLRRVRDQQPESLRRWMPSVPADLEAVCDKCLEKEPQNRYLSAADLAADLRRYLRGETTAVRPDTRLQAAGRWIRRHPAHAGLIGALAALVAVIIFGLAAYNVRLAKFNLVLQDALEISKEAASSASRSKRHAQQLLYASDMSRAAHAWVDGDFRDVFRILRRHIPDEQDGEHRGFEWWWFWQLVCGSHETVAMHNDPAYFVTFSPDEQWVASGGQDGIVRLSEMHLPHDQIRWESGQGEVNGIAFSSDGRRLATAGDDGSIRIWDRESRDLVRHIDAFESLAFGVLFAQSDRLLVTCGDDPVIRLWDAQSGQSAGELTGHERAVEQIALSPDGRLLLSAGRDKTARIWDLASGQPIQTFSGGVGRLTCVAFSPDGNYIATGSVDSTVRLWEVSSGSNVEVYNHLDGIQSVIFSKAGQWILASDRGGTIRQWAVAETYEAGQGTPVVGREHWTAHDGRAYSLALSSGDRHLVSAGEDGAIRLWAPRTQEHERIMNAEMASIGEFFFAGSGQTVVGIGADGIYAWSLSTGERTTLDDKTQSGRDAAFSQCTDRLATGGPSGSLQIWNLAAGTIEAVWQIDTQSEVEPLCFLADGRDLALIDEERKEEILILSREGQLRTRVSAEPYCTLAACSPNGRFLAFNVLNDVVLWDLDTDTEHVRLIGHRSTVRAAAFSPDSDLIFTASHDRTVRIWDAQSGRQLFNCAGHRSIISDVACSPDGRTLASCDAQGRIKLWHVATGQELCDLQREPLPVVQVAFSPDGRRLGYLLDDGRIVILSAGEGE